MLVYSITDDSTFEGIKKIRDEVLGVHPNPKVPMILVGNKKDLEDDRAVTKEEAQALAKSFGSIDYVEVSAFKNEGVNELFEAIVKSIFNANPNAGALNTGTGAVMGAGAEAHDNTIAAPPKKKKTSKEDPEVCVLYSTSRNQLESIRYVRAVLQSRSVFLPAPVLGSHK